MAELKTKKNDASVAAFLRAVADPGQRQDCQGILRLMKEATGAEPRMWGKSIVGFGSYRYKYPTGREGEWFTTGFSPRKANLTLYLMGGFDTGLLQRLGKFKTGKCCLYVKRLGDVDLAARKELVKDSSARLKGLLRAKSGV